MDGLRPAPKHDYCNGVCEGCFAKKCPGHYICDAKNCRFSNGDFSSGDWNCEVEDFFTEPLFDLVTPLEADLHTPMCPHFLPLDIEKCKDENFQVYDYEPMTIGPELYDFRPEDVPFALEMCDRFMADLRGEDESERREEDGR